MAFLFPKKASKPAGQTALTGPNIQNSAYGLPIPIVYGTTRIGCNIIWYGDFQAIPASSSSGGGGKGGVLGGGGGKGGSGGGYNYYTSLEIALCEGPLTNVLDVFVDKNVTTLAALGYSLFPGEPEQAPWSYLTVNHPDQALGYSRVAYVAAANYSLGTSPQLPNHNFEVQGLLVIPEALDVPADQVVVDYLTSPYYGAGFPASRLGTLNQANEAHSIPGSGPYTITVTHAAVFVGNLDVVDGSGNIYTCVASSPGAAQYSFAAGVYTFSSANAGVSITIRYSWLSGLTQFSDYVIGTGWLISPAYTTQEQASQVLDDFATNLNSAWVWSSGVLTLIPYGDQAAGPYTPPSQPLFDLTDSDFLPNTNASTSSGANNTDPVLLSRKRPADVINSIKIEWLDRLNDYNAAVAEVKNQAYIDLFGLRQNASATAHMFTNGTLAQLSAQLQLQRQMICNIYQFTLDQRYLVLDPMDIVSITDSYLGLDRQWVRIREITENDDGTLTVVAEEYLDGTGSAAAYSFQEGSGFGANYNAPPGNVNTPVIFEPPDALGNGLEVWMAISGMDVPVWGGCQVWISTDDVTYALAGQISGPARQGMLTAALPTMIPAATGLTIDGTSTLGVDLGESGGALMSGSQTDALALNTLCYVDGELIAYKNATLVSGNAYDLTYLVRGAYGSTIGAHNSGTQFARLDAGIFKYAYPTSYIGTTIYLKFLSFNLYQGGLQTLDQVNAFSYAVLGSALTSALPDVTGLSSAYIAGLTRLTWNPVTDFRPVDYEIRLGTDWNSALFIGRTPLTQSPILGDGTYWVAAHYTVPNGPDIYSADPVDVIIAGSQLTSNVIATHDEAATGWSGTLTDTVINGSNQLTLDYSGNLLTATDWLSIPDFFSYGGLATSGTYQVPTGHRINIGRVAACNVLMTLGALAGYDLNAVDWLSIPSFLTATDLLGYDLGHRATATPQIRLSQDGSTWGAWQNWIPGSYSAMAFDFQVVLATSDPQVLAVLSDLIIAVDVPDLVQTGTNVSIASGGTAITYGAPFNGGPAGAATPNIQITILGGSAGDDVLLTSVSTSGFTVQVVNGGSGAARSINWIAQGY